MQKSIFCIFLLLVINSIQAQIDSTKAFESCRGKLPLPVKHFSKVIDQNKSTSNATHDVATIFISNVSDSIFSVCDGKILRFLQLDSAIHGVLINVGAYYLVYSSIKPTNLKKGDIIKQNQFIGFMSKDYSVDYNLSIQLFNKNAKEIPIYNWFKWE